MREIWHELGDGRRVFCAGFDGPSDRTPLLCLPGLTRNHRDFTPLTDRLAGSRPIYCVDMRGRGRSDYALDPDAEYLPHVELADATAIADALGLERLALVGVSRGGIQSMLWAALDAPRLAAVALVDIGPRIEMAGLAAIIRALSGRGAGFENYEKAGQALHRAYAAQFTGLSDADWTRFARRIFHEDSGGRVVAPYDSELVRVSAAAFKAGLAEFWELFDALAPVPLAVLRGANSDLLSAQTLREMSERHPDCAAVTVPGRGHCPFLDEAESVAAIDALLEKADSLETAAT